jgi:limonene-1,2-epoxide hydrolase
MESRMTPEETVLAFVAAWNALDYDRVYALMADNIVYHNIPMKPVTGIAKVKAGFDAWPVDSCEWILLNIATNGNIVLTERLDRFARGEDRINVPVMGAFEVADGKITHWRDYFDMTALKPEAGA